MAWSHQDQIESQRKYRSSQKGRSTQKAIDARRHAKKYKQLYGDDYVVGDPGNRAKIKKLREKEAQVKSGRIIHRCL